MTRGVQPLLSLLLISAPAVCAAHAHHVHVLRDGQLLVLWDHGPEVPLVVQLRPDQILCRGIDHDGCLLSASTHVLRPDRLHAGLGTDQQLLADGAASFPHHSHFLAGWDDISAAADSRDLRSCDDKTICGLNLVISCPLYFSRTQKNEGRDQAYRR